MLKIATVNLNGLRASIRKGFLDWLDNYDADIVCLQEIRVTEKDLPLAELKIKLNSHFLTQKTWIQWGRFSLQKEPQTINKIINNKTLMMNPGSFDLTISQYQ